MYIDIKNTSTRVTEDCCQKLKIVFRKGGYLFLLSVIYQHIYRRHCKVTGMFSGD